MPLAVFRANSRAMILCWAATVIFAVAMVVESNGSSQLILGIAFTVILAIVSICVSYAKLEVYEDRIVKRSVLGTQTVEVGNIDHVTLDVQATPRFGSATTALQFQIHTDHREVKPALIVQPNSWEGSDDVIGSIAFAIEKAGFKSEPTGSKDALGRKNMDGRIWTANGPAGD